MSHIIYSCDKLVTTGYALEVVPVPIASTACTLFAIVRFLMDCIQKRVVHIYIILYVTHAYCILQFISFMYCIMCGVKEVYRG